MAKEEMNHIHAVAISPDKANMVIRRGEHQYALIKRKDGITSDTSWRDKKLVSQMVIKAGYKQFKKPIKYKGFDKVEKSAKSVQRLDEQPTKKKKSKKDSLIAELGLENFRKDVTKSQELVIDLEKADNSHLPKDAERFSYTCDRNRNIVYIPVNRLKQVYQTDEALNPATVNKKAKAMKSGKAMPPVYVGYDYDVHDGHHSWHAAMKNGYTHVPCEVVGSDPNKVQEAIKKYKGVWKSISGNDYDERLKKLKARRVESPSLIIDENKRINPVEDERAWKDEVMENDKEFRSELGVEKSMETAIVLDLQKAVLNRGKLVKRRVAVRGKGGKVFYRMQWIDPHANIPGMQPHSGPDQTTFAHHEDDIKEMEKRQSNRFPVVHHPTEGLKNEYHNYSTDKKALAEAEEKYKKGEKLPPVKIDPHGKILDNHHLVDLAKKHGLSHVPSVVVGNPTLKKQLEDRLKDRVVQKDENGEETDLTAKHPNQGLTSETVADLDQFKNFTKKKYTKEYLMNEAERQGITWDKTNKDGDELPMNSKIMWMRAHQAIENHIKAGKTFEVRHDEKDVDKRMQQDGKDSIHKHFLKLLEKQGSKDALMEWARKNDITWKEKADPSMNWMYATVAIKDALAKGKMLDGVRTRQKGAMAAANLIVSPEIKEQVKALGNKYGKSNVMKRAEEVGITFDRMTKKGDELPENSNILWMRAHEAISKYIAQGNNFRMADQGDNNIKAQVGDYGGVKLDRMQAYAVDYAKRRSQNREPKAKKWAMKALMLDKGLSEEDASDMYDQFMQKARDAKILVHFDPFELLPNGVNLLDQFSSDGEFKNDFLLNRGLDREHRESLENYMFGDDFSEASDSERPNYGVIDLFNKGLKSHPYNGEVAFVLKKDTHARATGSHYDSNDIPYGEEGRWVRSMEDPHHLIIDRWTSRWKTPNKADGQRSRAFDSVLNGKEYKDDNRYFEAHLHGGLNFDRDVDHLLLPSSWISDDDHMDKHMKLLDFAVLHNLDVKYQNEDGSIMGADGDEVSGSTVEPEDIHEGGGK